MADETFEVAFETTGADEAVEDFQRVQGAQEQVVKGGDAQAKAARAQGAAVVQSNRAQTQSFVGLGSRVGQVSGAFGNLGSVVGTVNPKLGQMGSLVGAVGTAFTGATGALGPWGVALAGVTSVVALAGAAMNSTAEDAEKLNERFEQQRRRVQDLNDKYETLVNRIGQARERFNSLFGIGVESAAQAEQAVQQTADRIQATEQQIAGLRQSISRLETMDPTLSRDALQTQRRLLAMAEDRLAILEFQRDATRNLVDDTRTQVEAERAAEQGRREAERAAEDARNRAQQAYRDMMAERARLDAGADEANEAFHQRSLERIAELTREFESTGDILDPIERARRDAQTAIEATFADLDRRRAEAERQAAGQRAGERANIRGAGADMGADLAAFRGLAGDNAENERWRSALEQREDAYRAHQLALRDMDAASTDWTAEQFQRRVELHREALAIQRADQEAEAERMKELGAITGQMWDSIGGTVTDAAGEMFRFVVEGAEGGGDAFLAMLDSFLEATAIQYTIKALAEGAEAVAAAARYDYAAAAQHGIAAGMAVAVAAATGLASAAISVPSTAGAAAGPTPAGPPASAGAGGPTNITIQIYSPNAVYTKQEQGELIAGMVREAERMRPGSARL